jgi:dihydroorotate dehydrogenase electron transfer subunit
MISKTQMKIISNQIIAQDTYELVLENDYISNHAVPGQFLHIQVGEHTLRRPVSIANCDSFRNTVTIIFKVNGQGTNELSTYPVGANLDVLGPIGNGFPLHSNSTILLIGGGVGVPPLFYLGRTLKELGTNVISVLGFQHKKQVFYEEAFHQLGRSLIVTNDGSYGEKALVTDVLSKIGYYDYYYSCGPTPMLRAVTQQLYDKPGFISLEERMGCGVGACFACVLPTKNSTGYKKICKDGPVFPVGEVMI